MDVDHAPLLRCIRNHKVLLVSGTLGLQNTSKNSQNLETELKNIATGKNGVDWSTFPAKPLFYNSMVGMEIKVLLSCSA